VIGLRDAVGELRALADVISDLLAPGVWHLGLFIVAVELHGTGAALDCYQALECWMRSQGARFVRLGALAGNERAARFWRARGFVGTRRREGVSMGRLTHTLIAMAKPLGDTTLAEYLTLVPRDRPGSP
jgi:ribosomal protein S18 acetylase RimI-like enzyme